MREFFNRMRERVMTFFKGLDRNRQIIVIAGIVGAVLLVTIGILLLTRTKYVAVAQGLTPAEAQVITTKLDDLGISWRDDTGTASVISVPESDVSRARMEIAADVAASNFSWSDVFSSESITMTSQTREQMYIQATASKLEDSIKTLTAVDDAKVILQIPRESNYFITDDIQSKASVVLTLKSGATLSEEQVSGITNLVVSSVKDLTQENVTILDNTGIQLNDPDQYNGTYSASSQFDLQMKVQNQLQYDLTKFLEKLYGIDNVEVQPSVVLDFNQQTETQTLFSPPIEGETTGMLRSATTITEDVVNGSTASGVPGTDSNSGDTTSYVEGSDTASSYKNASETLNYELNEIYREIIKSQGTIQSLSIGIIINSNALVDGEMTDDHRTELIDLVAKSAGTDDANIRVLVQAFPDPMEYYNIYTSTDTTGLIFGIPIWALALVLLVTLAVVFAVLLILRRNRRKKEAEALELQRQSEESQRDLDEIDAVQEDKGSPKYHIEKFVDKNPEAAAALLRAWLNE
jgi:flagellar M-ring protein FliF